MKKLIFSLSAVIMLAAVSCKKDYTCDCTYTGGGLTQTASYTINATKSDAETACDANETSVTVGTETFKWACELK